MLLLDINLYKTLKRYNDMMGSPAIFVKMVGILFFKYATSLSKPLKKTLKMDIDFMGSHGYFVRTLRIVLHNTLTGTHFISLFESDF